MDHLIGFVGTYGPAIAAALICLAASLVAAFLLVLTWGDAEVELGSAADRLTWRRRSG